VIDVKTQAVVDAIPGGGPRPAGLAFTPNGKRLVVSLMGDPIFSPGSVRVITLATGEITPPVPVGFDPEQIRITPNGKRVYVANLLSDTVSVIDLAQNAVIATIPFQGPPGGRAGPFNLLVSQNGKEVYVGVVFQNYVAVIDTRSNAVVDTITTGFGPNGLAFSRDRRSLFVTNFFSSTIGQYDLKTGEELNVDSTVVGDPAFVKLTADGKHAYFGSAYGTEMSVFDTRAFTTVDTITTGVGSNALDICRSP